jgi:hypothetical protein
VPSAALYAGHQALRAWALRLSAVWPGAVAYADAVAIRFSGEAIQFLTSTGPFLAEPSKALLFGRCGLTKTEPVAVAFGKRFEKPHHAVTFIPTTETIGGTKFVKASVAARLRNSAAFSPELCRRNRASKKTATPQTIGFASL